MPALAQVKHAEAEGPEGRRLADEIARAMHYRPLMSRLARVETAYVEPEITAASPMTVDSAIVSFAPPPIPQRRAAALSVPDDSTSIEELIADAADAVTSTPPTADWLDKARRERQRDRMRNAAAWVTTCAIAASIVGGTLLMLRA